MTQGTETSTFRVLDGRYELTELVGSGGMGNVYRAHDLRLDRPVAVKVLRCTPDSVHRARLQAEARFAGSLQHPGIVRVHDYGEERAGTDLTPYVVMQLIEGEPLSQRLRRAGSLPPTEVAALLAGIGDALAAAHARGVVHRDLKPANVVVTPEDAPVLVDFGVARSDEADPLTETGFVIGTADYLSPEQVEGQRATPASDVYALGVMAHQCLTGTSPFHRETQIATALAHLRGEAAPLPGDAPAGLQALVLAMIDRDPAARPTAAEVAARAPAAARTPPPPPAPGRRRSRVGLVLAAAAVPVVTGLGLAVAGHDQAVPPAEAAAADPAPAVVRRAPDPIVARTTPVAETTVVDTTAPAPSATPDPSAAAPTRARSHAPGKTHAKTHGKAHGKAHAKAPGAPPGHRKDHGKPHARPHGKAHAHPHGHPHGKAHGHGRGPGGR